MPRPELPLHLDAHVLPMPAVVLPQTAGTPPAPLPPTAPPRSSRLAPAGRFRKENAGAMVTRLTPPAGPMPATATASGPMLGAPAGLAGAVSGLPPQSVLMSAGSSLAAMGCCPCLLLVVLHLLAGCLMPRTMMMTRSWRRGLRWLLPLALIPGQFPTLLARPELVAGQWRSAWSWWLPCSAVLLLTMRSRVM
jgi:hypothetical protein